MTPEEIAAEYTPRIDWSLVTAYTPATSPRFKARGVNEFGNEYVKWEGMILKHSLALG